MKPPTPKKKPLRPLPLRPTKMQVKPGRTVPLGRLGC
jgi:hypothetical protein